MTKLTLEIKAEDREAMLLLLRHLSWRLSKGDIACNAGSHRVSGHFAVEEIVESQGRTKESM